MTTSKEREKQQPPVDPMEGRRPWIRVDDARIEEDTERSGRYRVTISGHNLKMAISPPRIQVGGVDLRDVTFDPGGKQVTGTLPEKPESDEVTVDYGFAIGETSAHRQD
jgi:hypothetical protein